MFHLYHKQCPHCNLNYFGMTRQNPFKYKGTGKYWELHLKKHKVVPNTISVWDFDTRESCSNFALNFSQKNNIVESNEWANLRPENGMDGWVKGFQFSQEVKNKLSEMRKGKHLSSHFERGSRPWIADQERFWVTNDLENKMIIGSRKTYKLSPGFKYGRSQEFKKSNQCYLVQTPDGVFDSIGQAAKHYSLSYEGARGRFLRNTGKFTQWKILEKA